MLDGFFKKLLFSRQIKGEKGNLSILDIPVFILSVNTVVGLQEVIIKELGDFGVGEIYRAGKNAGINLAEEHKKRLNIRGPKLYSLIENLVEMGGWGDIAPQNQDYKNSRAIYIFYNSPFPPLYKKRGECSCHLIRGLIAGVHEVIFEREVDCFESKCKSKGNQFCEFIIKPTTEFDTRDKAVAIQLGVRNRYASK